MRNPASAMHVKLEMLKNIVSCNMGRSGTLSCRVSVKAMFPAEAIPVCVRLAEEEYRAI